MSDDPQLFGTDGIRAPFGTPPLDRTTVTRLGRALGRTLLEQGDGSEVILGGDSRTSTPTICLWLTQGLTTAGVSLRYVGVLPTPGIAHLARRLGAAAGIAVSASHNLPPDNGIKLVDGRGGKWSPEAEAALEARLGEEGEVDAVPESLPAPDRAAVALYRSALAAHLPGEAPLDDLSLVLDPAHGAAAPHAAPLFRALGARVTAIHDRADGARINRDCGSTHPEAMAAAVRAHGAELGIAFDGDADRAIFADETGVVRDGDAILYLWATALDEAGALNPRRIVVTSMSNLGLERALARRGIGVVRCGVGDRVVVATMKREGIALGGEQSGHVVHLPSSTTGDGLLTALTLAHIAAGARSEGRSLSERLGELVRYPQVLVNVRVDRKEPFDTLPEVVRTVRRIEERLGEEGRLLLRYSGTEPLARVMIEGPEQAEIEALAEELAAVIDSALGCPGPEQARQEVRR